MRARVHAPRRESKYQKSGDAQEPSPQCSLRSVPLAQCNAIPMPALVITNAVLIRFIWGTAAAASAVNVIGARKGGTTTINQGLADRLSASIKTHFTASGYGALVPATLGLRTVGVRDLSGPNLPEFVGTGAITLGTATGGKILPPQLAAVVTLRTAKAGKSFRGRMYLGLWHDSALDASGSMTPAANSAVAGFAAGLPTILSGEGLTAAVVSRKLASLEDITSSQVRDTQFETQRRRAIPGI